MNSHELFAIFTASVTGAAVHIIFDWLFSIRAWLSLVVSIVLLFVIESILHTEIGFMVFFLFLVLFPIAMIGSYFMGRARENQTDDPFSSHLAFFVLMCVQVFSLLASSLIASLVNPTWQKMGGNVVLAYYAMAVTSPSLTAFLLWLHRKSKTYPPEF